MKNNVLFLSTALVFLLFFISCSSDDDNATLNTAAEIESATIPNASDLLEKDAVIENDTITFILKEVPETFKFTPEFTLANGATIEPDGEERDFSEPQTYTVTSEDEIEQKNYIVIFRIVEVIANKYSFENAKTIDTNNPEGHYHVFYEVENDTEKDLWASGNDGFNIMAATLVDTTVTPEDYPTYQTSEGFDNKGAQLITMSTGPLGAMFGSPMAAGNLYIGDFEFTTPLINSTKFGKPYEFDTAPVALKGYFKYEAGENFEVNDEENSELSGDTWDAYAILFKDEDGTTLSGDHNFEDERIVSVAKLDDAQSVEADEWTEFNITFEGVDGKSFDPEENYMFTIVFSSSKEGAYFNGAAGSKLSIDEVELIVEP